MSGVPYDLIAQQLLRAARGDRSQVAFSRRLGFKSNVVARWESGQRFPVASVALRAMELGGFDVTGALTRVHPQRRGPKGLGDDALAAWLGVLMGRTSQQELAARAEVSPSVVSRWLSGQTRLRLPDLLRCLDAMTGILSSFVNDLASLEAVPAAAPAAPTRVVSAAEVVFEFPIASFVNILLRTPAYRRLPTHLPAWLADRAGTDVATIQETIAAMERAGLVALEGDHYTTTTPPGLAHVPPSRAQARRLREVQLGALARRPSTGAPIDPGDNFAMLHMVCSPEAMAEVRDVFRRAFAEARMVAQSHDTGVDTEQRACVVAVDMLTLG